MKLDCFEEVKRLTSEMVAIPSINKEPHGETAVARYVYNYFMDLPYFKAHPEQVMCFQTKDDFVERHSTLAYVKGTKGTSNRTVILIGHIDTVGVDDFGTIREYAFKTDELPQKLKETFSLTPEVLADIESGDYMFGRGALDMKSGVAGHMYLVKYFSEHPEELDGNLVQIAECDEEDNSHGIITAIDYLLDLKKKEHFEYVACINADYSTNYMPGDENRYIYYGSIGKLLPCFVALPALHTVTPFQWAEGEQAEDLSAAIKSIIVQLGITTAPGGIQGPLRQLLVSDGQATPCPSVQSQNQAVHGGSFRKNSKTHPQGKHTLWVCLCFNSRCAGKIHLVMDYKVTPRPKVSIPAMRVRYIVLHSSAGNDTPDVSIPAMRVRYITMTPDEIAKLKVSIPAMRVRYILDLKQSVLQCVGFNSRYAGKIHHLACCI